MTISDTLLELIQKPTEPEIDNTDFVVEYVKAKSIGGISLISAVDLPVQGTCMAIYGFPGTGKSWLAAQAAKSKHGAPLLYIDAEGGSTIVRGLPNIEIAQVRNWNQFDMIAKAIVATPKDKMPFKSIVIDNMSDLQGKNMKKIRPTGPAQLQDWRESTNEILNHVTALRDYAQATGVNIIFIAWAFVEKDENTGIVKSTVGFTPSLANSFPGFIDVVAQLTIENDAKGTRCLNFQAGPKTAAKFRRNKLENSMKIPNQIYYDVTQEPMVDILNTMKGTDDFPADKYKKKA